MLHLLQKYNNFVINSSKWTKYECITTSLRTKEETTQWVTGDSLHKKYEDDFWDYQGTESYSTVGVIMETKAHFVKLHQSYIFGGDQRTGAALNELSTLRSR